MAAQDIGDPAQVEFPTVRARLRAGGGKVTFGTDLATMLVVVVALALLVGIRFTFPTP